MYTTALSAGVGTVTRVCTRVRTLLARQACATRGLEAAVRMFLTFLNTERPTRGITTESRSWRTKSWVERRSLIMRHSQVLCTRSICSLPWSQNLHTWAMIGLHSLQSFEAAQLQVEAGSLSKCETGDDSAGILAHFEQVVPLSAQPVT